MTSYLCRSSTAVLPVTTWWHIGRHATLIRQLVWQRMYNRDRVAMGELTTIAAKAYVPAKDFILSKQFYQDLGFEVVWVV